MQGQQSTVTESFNDYGQKLLAFIRERIGNELEAEDILQDVWYQLANTTEIIEQVGAWLYRVARNKIIDRYRKKKPLFFSDYYDEDEEFTFNDILLSDDGDPELQFLKNIFWEQLYLALDELPHEQKEAFILHELEGRPFGEIADMTGENVKTLISRKGYAVKHLRQRLQTVYDEFLND